MAWEGGKRTELAQKVVGEEADSVVVEVAVGGGVDERASNDRADPVAKAVHHIQIFFGTCCMEMAKSVAFRSWG